MFRGFLAGVVWGGLASVLLLGLVSLVAPPVEAPRATDSPAALDAPEPGPPEPPAEVEERAPDADAESAPEAPETPEQTEGRPAAPDAAPAMGEVTAPAPHEGDDEAPEIAARPDGPTDPESRIGPLSALGPDATPEQADEATPRPQVQVPEPRFGAAPDMDGPDAAVHAPGFDDGVAAVTPQVGQPVAPDATPGEAAQDSAPAPVLQLDPPPGPGTPADARSEAQTGPGGPATVDEDALQADRSPPQAMPSAGADAPPGIVFPQIAPDEDPGPPAAAPEPDPESDPAQAAPDAPRTGLTPAPGVETTRLPRIGVDPPDGEPDAGPAAPPGETQADAEADAPDGPLPALRRNAADFDNPDDRPLFAVIVMDEGISAQDQTRVARLPFPVTVAVDPTLPDAADRAALYRREGKEVLMLASAIPSGASASDLEVTFQSHFGALPDAVGVLDLPEGGFQNDRFLAEQVVTILADDGYGLVTFDRGMNAAEQVARSAGLGAERVFRILDAEGEQAATIRRYLDRAVFRAAQRGSVIVLGGSGEETLAGILEWRLEGRADAVALAPVSAVLMSAQ